VHRMYFHRSLTLFEIGYGTEMSEIAGVDDMVGWGGAEGRGGISNGMKLIRNKNFNFIYKLSLDNL
jgi:hypothetical protein